MAGADRRWREERQPSQRAGADGRRVAIEARRYVVAAGGLGSTRLLFASTRHDPYGLGNHSQHLGHWYMAHVEVRVGRVRFATPPEQTIYGHERDSDGVYVRRRFTFSPEAQRALELPNVAMWMVNPEIGDASHGSGILSFVYLMLISPLGRYFVAEGIRRAHTKSARPATVRAHLRNVARDLGPAAAFAASFGYRRFLKRGRKVPGFFVPSAANTYPLLYHGEHLPHWQSYVEPGPERDALGMPRLRTHLHFDDEDVRAVRRAHELLDRSLREQGLGEVEYLDDDVEGGGARAALRRLSPGWHDADVRAGRGRGGRYRPRRPRLRGPLRRQQLGLPDLEPGELDLHPDRLCAPPRRPPRRRTERAAAGGRGGGGMIRVGVVGLGKMGLSHHALLRRPSRGRAGRDLRLARATCSASWRSTPGSTTYGDYDAMLAEADLDAVVIATPSQCPRARWSRRPWSAACTSSARSR